MENNIKKSYEKKEKLFKSYIKDDLSNSDKNYKIDFDKTNLDILYLLEDNKRLFTANYKFIGIYNPEKQMWIWSNSIPGTNKSLTKIVKKIKKHSTLFDDLESNESEFYYQLLTENSIYLPVDTEKYLKMIIRLVIYLTDDVWYLFPPSKNGIRQLITLSKIIN